jgi:hypothetical protein
VKANISANQFISNNSITDHISVNKNVLKNNKALTKGQ